MNAAANASLADAEPTPFWLSDQGRPEPAETLSGSLETELAVVGGGFAGLWTALLAKEEDPGRDVVIVEARECGWAATGRNGGFCAASLTHGLPNGVARFPDEIAQLERLGLQNLAGIESAIERYRIDCDWERTGELTVATQPWMLADLHELVSLGAEYGRTLSFLDRDAVRAEVDSPTYLGGAWDREGTAMVHPARLAWGLRRACLDLGVRIFEYSPVSSISGGRERLTLSTATGALTADRVALATNAFPPLLRRLRHYLVPVYDYALMTEPLDAEQLASVGWRNRQGLADSANQFHYYRMTSDNRILWGGYDAVYRFGGPVDARYDQSHPTFELLSQHFFETFPQLEGLRFTHRWGGVIDTCSRFCSFWDTAYDGRLAYAAGYTGLGVGATRFAAQVVLDLLAGRSNERTELDFVRRKPLPFPPEPFRFAGISLTRWSLDRADRASGRRNLWLRTLDRVGLGFDS